ncbi:hypothetical protein ASJ83_06225 [Methanocorpusculum parvum]|uniref:Uncharacterized protein n=1 Tax=Methanocorpusculum parvum TaxID=2193 RepID=A0AAX0Q8P9_9EURY|nr:hypothetical protein ASJ83_06225 [Methanocorpusculum parvum]
MCRAASAEVVCFSSDPPQLRDLTVPASAEVVRVPRPTRLRAGVAAPHPRSRKGIVHLFFAEKKTCKIRKTRMQVSEAKRRAN